MILPAPPLRVRKPRVNVLRVPRAAAVPVVTGPVLVGASFDASTFNLTLTFDRAVNVIDGYLVAETMTVLHGPHEAEYLNTPDAEGLGTTTLTITTFGNAPWVGEGVSLTAGGGTGIVAASDGQTWSGVTDLSLPYP